MRETQEIQLFTVTFNTVKYTKSELMGKMPWHSQEPDFSFSLSLFLPELLCILCYFWNKVLWFVFFFFLRNSGSLHPRLTVSTACLQFAGEKIANLQRRTSVHIRLQQTRFVQSVMTLTSLAGAQHHRASFCGRLSSHSGAASPRARCRIEPLMRHAFCTLFFKASHCSSAKCKEGRQEPDVVQLENSLETCLVLWAVRL